MLAPKQKTGRIHPLLCSSISKTAQRFSAEDLDGKTNRVPRGRQVAVFVVERCLGTHGGVPSRIAVAWGARAPRTLVAAPSPRRTFLPVSFANSCTLRRTAFRRGAEKCVRGARAPQNLGAAPRLIGKNRYGFAEGAAVGAEGAAVGAAVAASGGLAIGIPD